MKLFALLSLILTFAQYNFAASSNKPEAKLTKPEAKLTQGTAVFAAGCFWCIQPPYDKLKDKGVISATVGYSGGDLDQPTYEQVSAGGTGHLEVIEVVFNPDKISYAELLKVFWKNIDPLDSKGQFCDKGPQYVSAIFYADSAQKAEADKSLKALQEGSLKGKTIATQILPQKKFFSAEEYHQSYYSKNPIRYKFYRGNCGRDKRLAEVWGSLENKPL